MAQTGSRILNILLVEDNDDHAGLFSEFLSAGVILWGAGRVTRVRTLAEAQAHLHDTLVDVVILDLGLPDSDGLDTLRAMLRLATTSAIVVMTAEDNRALGLSSIELGAQDFLVKGEITEETISRAVRYAHERKQSLVALADRNIDLETFRRIMGNDLRGPLRKIKFISDLLVTDLAGQMTAEHRDYLQKLPALCDEIRELIDGLENFVKAGGKPEQSPVSLAPLAEEVRDALPEAQRACIHIDVLPTVRGDRTLLRDVFEQLIDNGLRYSGERVARVDISATVDRDIVSVAVEDGGVGMPTTDLGALFDAALHARRTRTEPGTGLGLAICERIVRAHGGRIWAESRPGEGSTVRFTLPAA